MNLSKRLKELRISKGLNQTDLANLLNVDRSTYGKYETGDSSPDYGKLIKLANFYRVSLDYLLDRGIDAIGHFIKEERESQGLTEKELASAIGISEDELLQYEANEKPISETLLEKIVNVFGMSLITFLNEYDLYDEYIPSIFDRDADAYETFKKAVDEDVLNEHAEKALLSNFSKLNIEGKKEAIKRIEELAQINKYMKATTKKRLRKSPYSYNSDIIAAHNDDNSQEQIELMKKDIDEL